MLYFFVCWSFASEASLLVDVEGSSLVDVDVEGSSLVDVEGSSLVVASCGCGCGVPEPNAPLVDVEGSSKNELSRMDYNTLTSAVVQ